MTFFGKPREAADAHGHDAHHASPDDQHGPGHDDHAVHESPAVMLYPLAVLAAGALFTGLMFKSSFIGSGFEQFWKAALFIGPNNHILEDMEKVPLLVSLLPTLFMIVGFAVSYYMYILKPEMPARLAREHNILYRFLLNKWYFDELYDFIFVKPAFWLGRLFWKGGDGRIIDGLGPDGVSARVIDVARGAVKLQTGYVYHYAFAMLIGVAAFVTWYMVKVG
jgi:NADH-quinone oxidoreductase subunit L